jgi:DNA processing protein
MTLSERAARAYLTRIAEPADSTVGQLLTEHSAADTVRVLWDQKHRTVNYRLRMDLGDDQAVTDWLQAIQHREQLTFITPQDADWPTGLDDLGEQTPYGLWIRGNVVAVGALDTNRSVGVVGARAATAYGEHVAREITSDLVQNKILIVSGLAYGIDGAAHRAAIEAGGLTVAFVAGGAERVYPAGHQELARRLASSGGAMVAEVPPGSAPTKWRFLARNRLIAAASQAVVVVEAGWRSGSLNTANHATSLGRPLGAVPGPVTSPASSGCHKIIQDRTARLVTSAEDVLTMMALPQQTPVTLAGLEVES